MTKLYKKKQLQELKQKYSKEILKEAEEIIVLLDGNYGANRDVDKDLGGYIALLESKEDVTEIAVLEAKNLYMDYTFLMEYDTYIHVEFQSTDKGKVDLRRFRAYESLLSFQTSKDVVTYVVYSNGIYNTKSTLQTGINEYNVKAVSMYDKDGDIIIQEVEEKLNNNIEVTKQELVALTFTPIMSGKLTKLDRIIKSIRTVKKIDNEYTYDIESMLYAFADKW